ncbi:hypothetical protein BJV78DRAFT_1157298 [Lactifluus subvellereus]|nr:hypothetical protein BJV78DRAFT_1157298 [Lactifluus subvellereus]
MATKIAIMIGEEWVPIIPRIGDDLPKHVRGEAYWVVYGDPTRNCYAIKDPEGIEYPIEFINNRWYLMKWEDGMYYTKKKLMCEIGEYGTGWWKNMDKDHPDYVKPLLSPHSPRGKEPEEDLPEEHMETTGPSTQRVGPARQDLR